MIYLRRSTLLQMLGLIGAFIAFILIAKYVAGNFDYGSSFGDINVGDDVVQGTWRWDASVTAKDLGYDLPKYGEARMNLQLNVRNIAEVKQKLDAGYTLAGIYVENMHYRIKTEGSGDYLWSIYLNGYKWVDRSESRGTQENSYAVGIYTWYNGTDTIYCHVYVSAHTTGGLASEAKITLSDIELELEIHLYAPGSGSSLVLRVVSHA